MCADTYRDTKIIKKQTPEMAKVRKDSQHILSSLTRYIKNSTPRFAVCLRVGLQSASIQKTETRSRRFGGQQYCDRKATVANASLKVTGKRFLKQRGGEGRGGEEGEVAETGKDWTGRGTCTERWMGTASIIGGTC